MAKRLESALIATCSDILDDSGERVRHSSPAWPLLDYFSRHARQCTVLELSQPRKGMLFRPQVLRFENGRLMRMHRWVSLATRPFTIAPETITPRTYKRLKVRDLLACFWAWGLYPQRYQLFVGVESLLAMQGGLFKGMGMVESVAYYISDWSPWKFEDQLLNRVYLEMDRAACRVSDYIWNFTPAIEHARRDILHFDDSAFGKQLWVPFGFIPDGVVVPPDDAVDFNRLVFCGGINAENGMECIIQALPDIRKALPDIRLEVLGDGPDMPRLQVMATQMGLDNCVTWRGFVTDRKEILKAQLGAAVALAPYAPLKNSVKRFGDVIKIREAVGCGLPVITTEVPPSHVEVREKNLGRVIPYSPKALSAAVVEMLSDRAAYFAVRANVVAASSDNLWENIYGRTLTAMGMLDRPSPEG